ncbi:MAG TPA: hypothetical protein PKD64_11745 [Pirellulaceae bacterium]|nr:hypothetical protein [Pirellulaceae bacterium]HMO92857.1 hypothetical protein [Pirellulaceae bacterium]HMP69401.1 hypothetical protein [Pirellulaceae bacterium]
MSYNQNQNPYSFGASEPPTGALPEHLQPRRKSSATRIVIIILGILFFLGLGCCACGFGFWMFSISALETAVKTQFQDDPRVVNELGSLDTVKFDFWKSVEEQQNRGRQFFYFTVTGSRETGAIIVSDQVSNRFNTAYLITPDGSEIEL